MRERGWHDIRGRSPLLRRVRFLQERIACANGDGTTFADKVRSYFRLWISTQASPLPRGSLAAWTRLMRLSR